MKELLKNKKINLNYEILDTIEAGIVLLGKEVKSLLKSNGSIDEAFAFIKNGEIFVINMYIAPLQNALNDGYIPTHKRKLLLNKHEIQQLEYKSKKDQLAIVCDSIYTKNGKIKIKLALVKAKKR
jgi:SsrA-binding protein